MLLGMSDTTPDNVTKLPLPAAPAAEERREFDPLKSERLALSGISQQINALQQQASEILTESAQRLGLGDGWQVGYNLATNKIQATKKS